MKNLIVSTLPQGDDTAAGAVAELTSRLGRAKALYTGKMNLHSCVGCNDCWLKTPGLCSIRDDYEKLLIQFLQADRILFLTEARRGFVCAQMKNMIDRILPLDTMYLHFQNGQMRHVPRYKKQLEMGLLYTGDGNLEYLTAWMERVALNIHAKSLGAYELENREGVYHALGNH